MIAGTSHDAVETLATGKPLAAEAATGRRWAVAAWVRDASLLARPRIAVMVLATVAAAAWLTAGRPADPAAFARLIVGTFLVAASSSVANQIVERRSDRLMDRTRERPLAAGRLGAGRAATIAAISLAAGLSLTVAGSGWPAAVASGSIWLVYVVAYTPLKRFTPLNTAVGAVVGALPVAIGWLAAGGPDRFRAGDTHSALAAAALATVLYLWQFPHFMAIAWIYRRQYADAGLRMLTVVDPSGLRAAGQALSAALALVPASLVLAVPSGSVRFFWAAALLSITYAVATVRFAVRRDTPAARQLLLTSLGVLVGLLVSAVLFGCPADGS